MRAAVPHPVPTTYLFAQILYRVPSDCSHTATALPPRSTATLGYSAPPALSVSMSVAPPHPDPATYRFAKMLNRVPSDCYHTAAAFPLSSTATCGSKASPTLSVSRRVAVPQPDAAAYRLAQMLFRVPSLCAHTAIASPLP